MGMPDNDPSSETSPSESSTKKSRKLLILLICFVVVAVIAIRLSMDRRVADVTEESLQAAINTWESQRPPNYRLSVRIKGPRTGTYAIEVKNHQVDNYSFNGQLLTNERTKQTWTGRGMLRFLEWDLEEQRKSAKKGVQLMVRAEFDETFGLPFKYQRLDFSTRQSISWEVTEFTPLGE